MIRRTEIEVPQALLDSYVGQYEAAGEGTFDVARSGEHLTIRFPDDTAQTCLAALTSPCSPAADHTFREVVGAAAIEQYKIVDQKL
jgi:hypothetical protein